MSDESVAKWNCTSGRVASGSARANMPPWLMPTRHRAAAREHVLEAHRQRAPGLFRSSLVVIGLRALEDDARLQMILQVLADARQLVARRRCRASRSTRAGPMPESCRSCGRLQRARAEQHFARAPSRVHRPRRRAR